MLTAGSALVASGILLTALTALLFRRPNPPRWTRPDLVAMSIAVPLTAIMGLGFVCFLAAISLSRSGIDLRDVAGTVAVWLVAAVVWKRLDVRARLEAYAVTGRASADARPGAGAPANSQPPRQGQPAGPSRLEAA